MTRPPRSRPGMPVSRARNFKNRAEPVSLETPIGERRIRTSAISYPEDAQEPRSRVVHCFAAASGARHTDVTREKVLKLRFGIETADKTLKGRQGV